MNFKKIIVAALAVFSLLVGCQDDDEGITFQDTYDAQKTEIQSFLELNYYDADDATDHFKLISNQTGKKALIADANLKSITTIRNGVEYTIYTYLTHQEAVVEDGSNVIDNNDIVKVALKPFSLTEQEVAGVNLISESETFVNLQDRTDALAVALPFFVGGTFKEDENDKPREFTGGSEGYVFCPTNTVQEFSSENRFVVLYEVRSKFVTKVANE